MAALPDAVKDTFFFPYFSVSFNEKSGVWDSSATATVAGLIS